MRYKPPSFFTTFTTFVLLLIFVGTLLIAPFFATIASANNSAVKIICKNKADCEQVGGATPFFTAENMVPGQSVQKSVQVHNQRKNEGCTIKIRGTETANELEQNLKNQLVLNVLYNSQKLVSYDLATVLSTTTPLPIDTLNAQTSRDYDWQLYFKDSAHNSYQGSKINFDLHLIFTCDPSTTEPIPTPTLTPSPSATPLPDCTIKPPTEKPIVTIASQKNPTTLSVQWTSVPTATNYKLSFATTDTSRRYENTSLGNTQQHSVTGLHPQKDYFFVITPYHSCAAGPSSDPVFMNRDPTQTKPVDATDQLEGSDKTSLDPPGQVLGAQIIATEGADINLDSSDNKRSLVGQFSILTGDAINASGVGFTAFLIAVIVLFMLFRYKKMHKKPTS